MSLRSAQDTRRSIGYTIDYLESVVASPQLGCYVDENPLEYIPFTTTHECDMTEEDVYSTLLDEQDSDEARSNSIGASSQHLVFIIIKGADHALDKTCLQAIDRSAPALEYLLNVGWTTQRLAAVNFRSLDKRKFCHTIDFLVPPSPGFDYPSDLCRDIASGAEWIIPRKRERSDSQNFVQHSRRIAISLARDILRCYAAQLLTKLENKETDDMRLRLFEAYLPTDGNDFKTVLDQIEMKKKEIDRMMSQLEAYKRKIIDKSYDPYARVTERDEAAMTLRDKVEKADAEALAFKQKREREILQLQSKVADAGKGKRLRETVETSWVFRWFHSNNEPDAMHTPSIRTILSDSEVHPNAATVNETLMRLGKQSNVQLFCESVIPFVPLHRQ